MSLQQKKIELLLSLLIVLFLLWILWEPRNWPEPARFYPWSLGLTVLGLALIQLAVAARAVIKHRRTGAQLSADSRAQRNPENSRAKNRKNDANEESNGGANVLMIEHAEPDQDSSRQRTVAICVWIVVFFLGIWLIGFKIGAFLLTVTFMRFTAKEKWSISAAMGLGTFLFFWLVFDVALKVPLGNGVLADYFSSN